MIRWLLEKLGYQVDYVCDWGAWSHRYDYIDHACNRPIHPGMSVAPPWARLRISRPTHPHQGER